MGRMNCASSSLTHPTCEPVVSDNLVCPDVGTADFPTLSMMEPRSVVLSTAFFGHPRTGLASILLLQLVTFLNKKVIAPGY